MLQINKDIKNPELVQAILNLHKNRSVQRQVTVLNEIGTRAQFIAPVIFSNEPQKNEDGTYHFSVIDTNRSQFLSRPATKQESLETLIRLTHKRSLLCMLIRSYASQRGWNENSAETTVLRLIEKREKKKKMLSKLK